MTEHHLEEHFTEEPVMDMDGTLVDAVERVLAHGGASTAPSSVRSHSHPHSAASSRSSSKKAAKIRVGAATVAAARDGRVATDASGERKGGAAEAAASSTQGAEDVGAGAGAGVGTGARGSTAPTVVPSGIGGPPSTTAAVVGTVGNENLEVPRQECRKMVLGALEQVARSVQAEGKHRGGSNAAIDSTLREGVRKWLSEVEEGHEAHGTPLAG
ncbi:MAG: hypothetical protein Q9157_009082 [Trypethelium eluteriae]